MISVVLDDRAVEAVFIAKQRIWSPYKQESYENGAAFYGTEGYLIVGHVTGWRMYGRKDKLIAQRSGLVDLVAHHTNFFDCIRGDQQKLNADVKAGHLSATVVHLANIGARVGEVLHFDHEKEQITNNKHANALVRRQYRDGHWPVPKGVARRQRRKKNPAKRIPCNESPQNH